MWGPLKNIIFAVFLILVSVNAVHAETLILASTTSTQNSGLFDYILPTIEKETGVRVHVVAVGTGAAIKLARNGDADVLMVHHKPSEEKFVSDGYGVERYDLMYNDFVLLGPQSDPAEIAGLNDLATVLQKIASTKSIFVSRGDDSGTHKREVELWKIAGVSAVANSGSWYLESGSGMGATLNTAVAMQGYVLADRATWLSFQNKQNMAILFEGDKRLFNQYGIVMVNPDRYPHVKSSAAHKLIHWLLSAKGQVKISSFNIGGEQLFTPNALP